MSRSNPTVNQNPTTRYFEWDGENGGVRHYDKDEKKNVYHDLPFTFIPLDQLAKVGGWHKQRDAGIYSNEVKRIASEPLTVKTFDGATVAEGLYKDIKNDIKVVGGHYVASIYIAVKDENGDLVIANLQLKGASLGSWMEFLKKERAQIYEKAVTISGFTEGTHGRITYRMPSFELRDLKEETNQDAIQLDKLLQQYLEGRQKYEPEQNVQTEYPDDQPQSRRDQSEKSFPEIDHNFDDLDDDLPF